MSACAACGEPVSVTDEGGCVGAGPHWHFKAECLLEATHREHAENERLRELYENVVGNRERFGWTINHLLECDEALRMAESERESVAQRADRLVVDIRLSMKTLQQQHAAAWQEVDRLHGLLREREGQIEELRLVASAATNEHLEGGGS